MHVKTAGDLARCCVFWPANTCVYMVEKDEKRLKITKKVHVLAWALRESLVCTMKKELLRYFSSIFHRFRPCKRMRKHEFAGWNTQHLLVFVSEWAWGESLQRNWCVGSFQKVGHHIRQFQWRIHLIFIIIIMWQRILKCFSRLSLTPKKIFYVISPPPPSIYTTISPNGHAFKMFLLLPVVVNRQISLEV